MSGGRTIRRRKSSWYELTPDRAFWLFAIFAAFAFLTGGGSRYDIEGIGPLRFVAAVTLAVALFFQTGKSLRRIAAPLFALLTLAIWMVFQLIPLPPSLWTNLPDRDVIATLDNLVGLSDNWRPITFSPAKTANSLASLTVPLAGLMVLALFNDHGWRRLPWVFMIAGLASALFGILQIILPQAGGLYMYEITNDGSAVGLFSNRNHNAMFLTMALVFCLFRIEKISRRKFGPADLVAIVIAFTIFAGILVNASRAGLVGLGIAGAIFAVRSFLQWRRDVSSASGGAWRMIISLAVGVFSLVLVGLFALLGRSPAIERLLAEDVAEDQRVQALPYLLDMLGVHQPFGVGFGAFEQAYRIIEPEALLNPRYLNNAHNDWLQFAIEGGVPAILIGLVGIALVVLRAVRIAKIENDNHGMRTNAWLGILVLGIFALGSIVDYPLRTPSLMLLAVAALAMMFKPIANAE